MYKLRIYNDCGESDDLYFNSFEKVKESICNNFLAWFFEIGNVIESQAEFEQVSDALDFFRKAEKYDIELMYFDNVFELKEISTVD